MRPALVLPTSLLLACLNEPAHAQTQNQGQAPSQAPAVYGAIAPPTPAAPRRSSDIPPPRRPASNIPAPRPFILSREQTKPAADPKLRRTQVDSTLMNAPVAPAPGIPDPGLPTVAATSAEPGMSLSLQAALYGALTGNPDLIALRQGNVASAEAVEVARRFPVTLNPTVWIDYRPISVIPPETFGGGGTAPSAGSRHSTFGKQFFYISWRQPIELGHQTRYRHAIAQAAFDQQRWTVVQAELTALVQTYRFFQTAAYRREKLRVAIELADFNEKLVQALRRRLEANQGLAADVALSEVENQATRQLVEAARQDYVTALTDLRTQLGMPETAGVAEPLGEFVLPAFIPAADDQALIQTALQSRPEIFAAKAQMQGAYAAICLARGDQKPTPVVGPLYQTDEVSVQYVGFVFISPIPIINNGAPLVRQREAEYNRAAVAVRQIEQRTIAQVKAAIQKWNQANQLVTRTNGLTNTLKTQVQAVEKLFEENQADLPKLLQARQRLIQLENARLDAIWAATQAQSDLLLALGAPSLIAAAQNQVVAADSAPAPVPAPPAPSTPAPFRSGAAARP